MGYGLRIFYLLLSYLYTKASKVRYMRKRMEVAMAVLLLLGVCFFAKEGVGVIGSMSHQDGGICVVIDAGHGGDDPGKIGINKVKEKEKIGRAHV